MVQAEEPVAAQESEALPGIPEAADEDDICESSSISHTTRRGVGRKERAEKRLRQ